MLFLKLSCFRNKAKILANFKFAILDIYIIRELIPTFVFSLLICCILGELIGISFEQIRFVVEQDLPINIAIWVHLLKLPFFVSTAFPFALSIATINIYKKLSSKNEIIALQSFGVSLYRLIMPALAIAIVISVIMFAINETIVPSANYKAAMLLEREWNVDRTKLAKYNKQEVVYQEFSGDRFKQNLKLLFFAERFDGEKMKEITIIQYRNLEINRIITASSATWNEDRQKWQLFSGIIYIVDFKSKHPYVQNFDKLSLNITRNILDYANHHRDNREMNIVELYNRLEIVKHTDNIKKIRELKISIQERYARSVSCIIFAFLGSTLGISSQRKINNSSFGIAIIAIFAYYFTQFLTIAFAIAGVINVFWGVWFPELLNLSIGLVILKSRDRR